MFNYYKEFAKTDKSHKENVIDKMNRQETYLDFFTTFITSIIALENFPTNYKVLQGFNVQYGISGIVKENGKYYMAQVMPSSLYRNDGRPNKVIATYMTENGLVTKEYTNDVDIILWYNNSYCMADKDIINWLSYALTEGDISILANIKYSRYNPLVRVKNQIEKMQIEEGLKGSKDGEIGIYVSDTTLADIADNAEKNNVLNITDVKNSDKIQYLTHYHLDIINRFYSVYGLPMNTTGKMAQQTEKEISGQDASAWALPLDMLANAKDFCDRFNKMFSENTSAHFGYLHELAWGRFANDCTKDDKPGDDIHNVNNDVNDVEGE